MPVLDALADQRPQQCDKMAWREGELEHGIRVRRKAMRGVFATIARRASSTTSTAAAVTTLPPHLLPRVLAEQAHHAELRRNGLARAGGGAQQHWVVAVVQRVEGLQSGVYVVMKAIQDSLAAAARGGWCGTACGRPAAQRRCVLIDSHKRPKSNAAAPGGRCGRGCVMPANTRASWV